MLVGGQPLVVRALREAAQCHGATEIVVVAPAGHRADMSQAVSDVDIPQQVAVAVVDGGAERRDSVALGLAALTDKIGIVLVHDAARALAPASVFNEVVSAVRSGHAAVVPTIPVVDTLKEVRATPLGEAVVATIDRSMVRVAQTPQGFLRETLARAHTQIEATHTSTDDAGMVEAMGPRVFTVPGDPRSMKITTSHDLAVADVWLQETS